MNLNRNIGKSKKQIPNLDWIYETDIGVDTNSWQDVLKKYCDNNGIGDELIYL